MNVNFLKKSCELLSTMTSLWKGGECKNKAVRTKPVGFASPTPTSQATKHGRPACVRMHVCSGLEGRLPFAGGGTEVLGGVGRDAPRGTLFVPRSEPCLGRGPAFPSATLTLLEDPQESGTEERGTHVSRPLWCLRKFTGASRVQEASLFGR